MNDMQKPLNSGFSSRSTASEVVSGLNLTGLKVVVTGGHSGIGFETSLALSQAGAQVIVGARQQKEAESRLRGTPRVEVAELDLSSPESIADFASQVMCSGQLILATRPDCSWNSRSDSFGVKPPLYQWGRMAL